MRSFKKKGLFSENHVDSSGIIVWNIRGIVDPFCFLTFLDPLYKLPHPSNNCIIDINCLYENRDVMYITDEKNFSTFLLL